MSTNFDDSLIYIIITFVVLIMFGIFIFAIISIYAKKDIEQGKYTKVQKNTLKEKEEFTQNVINQDEELENDDNPIDYK